MEKFAGPLLDRSSVLFISLHTFHLFITGFENFPGHPSATIDHVDADVICTHFHSPFYSNPGRTCCRAAERNRAGRKYISRGQKAGVREREGDENGTRTRAARNFQRTSKGPYYTLYSIDWP